ncbi:MAG: hypothetical protein J2P23_01975 [Microlunatus sp.]|nr:hypothetical protein [Microlunatus sp.]
MWPSIAALAVAYAFEPTIAPGWPATPLKMLTIRPQPAASMSGNRANVIITGAVMLISNDFRQASASMSGPLWPSGDSTAALLNTMSAPPSSAAARRAIRAGSSRPRSARTVAAVPPARRTVLAT